MSPFTKGHMDFLRWLDVVNCFKLDKSMQENILEKLVLRVETSLPQLRSRHRKFWVNDYYAEVLVCYLGFDFRIAGGELPERIKYKNENGSNIFMSMEQYEPLDFMVMAFSAVVASTSYEALNGGESLQCECCFVTESGRALVFNCERTGCNLTSFSCNRKFDNILENVLFWLSKVHFHDKHRFTSFKSAKSLQNSGLEEDKTIIMSEN